MSLYKPKGSPFWHYDFWHDNTRFHGSTKAGTKAAAKVVEDREKAKARGAAAAKRAAEAAFRGEAPLTVDLAAGRWYHEVGQHNVNATTDWANLERLIAWFKPGRRLDTITDADTAEWVASRRGERVQRKWKKRPKGAKPEKLVSVATVNRTTTDMLRRLFVRARKTWKLPFANEPDWSKHRLTEARRVEEVRADDEDDIFARLHNGYGAFFRFAMVSGLRLAECLLRKRQVDWTEGTITVTQKGGRTHVIPITRAIAAILQGEWERHAEWVFTFAARRASKAAGRARGQRCPITYEGIKTEWRRKVREDLPIRFHAARHTRATRLIRRTGDLKAAQELLGHAQITTTGTYYAHALIEDVRAKLDAADEAQQKSRNTSRNRAKREG